MELTVAEPAVRHGSAAVRVGWVGRVGLVWSGLVWSGLVWYGMVWYGMADRACRDETEQNRMTRACGSQPVRGCKPERN